MLDETLGRPRNVQTSEWEGLSDVEFAGGKFFENPENHTKNAEKVDIQGNLAEIRKILDTRSIAQNNDPAGLAKAREKDLSILASCDSQLKELENRVAEYDTLEKASDEYAESGRYANLIRERNNREKSRVHKILAFFHRPDKELDEINAELEKVDKIKDRETELATRGYSNEKGVEKIRRAIDKLAKTATNEDEFLENFETPLSREQKDRLLDYDTLAELSTDEYLRLWRHLDPHYVSHVTRQGYRDHAAMFYHTAGLGEMTTSFTDSLKSDKILRSNIGIKTGHSKSDLLKNEDAFNSYMEKIYFKDGIPESLLGSKDLSPIIVASEMGGGHEILSKPGGFWRDRTSVHVAKNNVLNSHYGAESGNEIFYVFPADVVMSQSSVDQNLLYGGHKEVKIGEQTRKIPYDSQEDHNDVSIFVDDGLPIDAGLVFIPKDTLVDPSTGSKYNDFDLKTRTMDVMTKENGGIPAEEYWENYFKKHPEEKPAHIIYYNGDPEAAVAETLAGNGIYVGDHGDTSKKTGPEFSFDDKMPLNGNDADRRLVDESERFWSKVMDYIDKNR